MFTSQPGAAERAVQRVERELALAYHDLGAAAFALAHHGALRDPRLSARIRRIYELTDARALAGQEALPPTRSLSWVAARS